MDTEELQSNQKHIRIHIFSLQLLWKAQKIWRKNKKDRPHNPEK